MKICDLVFAYNDKSGGIKTYIREKRKFIEENTRAHHVLIVPERESGCIRSAGHSLYHVSSPILPGNQPYRIFYRMDKVLSILNREEPDIIEIDSIYTLPWAAFMYRHFRPCKVIGYYHADFPTTYVQPVISRSLGAFCGKKAEGLTKYYAGYVYDKCDATVTSSRIFKEKLSGWGVRNVIQIPLGVDLRTFHPEKRNLALRESMGARQNDPIFVYSGRLNNEKRVGLLCRAFMRLPQKTNAHLVIIGEGPQKRDLMCMTAKNPRVHFIPYLSDRNSLAMYLASSDLYLTACPFETFGLSVIEAQASGLAAVGVRAGALPERIPPELGLLAEMDSEDGFLRSMTEIMKMDFRKMGLNARAYTEANFSWESTFARLFSVYHSLFAKDKIDFMPDMQALSMG